MTLLLTLLFVLSGAAGLIYESIWSRYLGLLVGHSAYAQVIVLVIFLGGMSAGAALAARRSSRLREPLLWYALIEGLVGLIGLVFHEIFTGASGFAYDTLFPALGGGLALLVGKWILAALLILPQSILLGATFPLMTAGLLRRLGDPAAQLRGSGQVLGLLYFANSFGAAAGVLFAGFYLIGLAGLPGTLVVAAVLNIVVALGTYGLVRLAREDEAPVAAFGETEAHADDSENVGDARVDGVTDATTPSDAEFRGKLTRLLLAVSFGTAVASFIYEIAWIRMLSLVLGSATHSFELMLSAFILGLALGALVVRQWADDTRDSLRLLGLVQFAMGALAIATLGIYLGAFDWMAGLMQTVQRNEPGYAAFNLARYAFALAVMLPSTFCAGMTLPLITRNLLGAGGGERAIGTVYAWNTLGSIVGVALASLVLLPMLGLRGLLILGGGLDIALGVWLLRWRAREQPEMRRTARLALGAGAAVVLGAVLSPAFDPGILTSGVFRYGAVPAAGSRQILFYKDGRTATVSVQFGADSGYTIATNGKPDASLTRHWFNTPTPGALPALRGDDATQVLLPLITLAHAPQARQMAVIGHGSGMSSHFLLGSPAVERVTTIDIEPQMVEAARLLMPTNRRVYEDPRSTFVYDDAKSYFAAAGRQFDLILSEPSNPWVSGVSGLFTDEFYSRVATYLAPGGVFGQWLHLYEIEDDLVLSVLVALDRHFASYALFLTNDVDMLVVASNEPELPRPDWSVFEREGIAQDLSRFRRITPAALEDTRLITSQELAPLLHGSEGVNSDFYPRLDLGAERARFLGHEASGLSILPKERFDLAAALGDRRLPPLDEATPAFTHSRFIAQGIATRLARADAAADTSDSSRRLQVARLRLQRLRLEWASGQAPVDWQLWLAEALAVERDLHQGSMGGVFTWWYDAMERYMASAGAPEGARSALRFLRAAASYEWSAAAAEIPTQIAERDRGIAWLPPGLFIDAAVVSRLKTNDITGARAALARLATASGRAPDDLRTLLLEAHVGAAERARETDSPAAGPTTR